MAERLTCSNCGAPMARAGNETRSTCPHCQHVTEFPPVASNDNFSQGGGGGGGGGGGPHILIIQEGPTVVHEHPQEVYVSSGPSIISWIIYAAIFFSFSGGIGGYVHHRSQAAKAAAASAGNEAENAAAKAQKEVGAAKEAAEKAEKEAANAGQPKVEHVERVPEHGPEHGPEHAPGPPPHGPEKGPPPKHH